MLINLWSSDAPWLFVPNRSALRVLSSVEWGFSTLDCDCGFRCDPYANLAPYGLANVLIALLSTSHPLSNRNVPILPYLEITDSV